ncbi:MAG: GNAT family N-acetyltransferase [Alphaproteobacteria bacterium]|nr:GNAT family N-acetyltransferase [Alphaproteobacteria bacterium]
MTDANLISVSSERASQLAKLHAECFGAAAWSLDQMRGSLDLATTRGWLVETGGQPEGFILFQETGAELEILTFCVAPSRRRRGVGERLLRHALAQVPLGGAMYLEVSAENAAARRLYERCGFLNTATRRAYYKEGDRRVDALCYRYIRTG